jgi:O-antigen/teichoic acid export membrane protein
MARGEQPPSPTDPPPGLLSRLRAVTPWAIVANAGSLVGTTAVTSTLGFAYWWLAARRFPPEAVGFAAASIAAMTLLGTVATCGFGTLLIGELPRHPGRAGALIATALATVGVAGGALGALLALAAPTLSANLRPLAASAGSVALFAAGVALTAVALVLDQALLGLLRGDLQLRRNALFAVVKLLALAPAGSWLPGGALTIYATWAAGNLASLLALILFAAAKGLAPGIGRPRWGLVRRLGRAALEHHALNLALQVPSLALPVMVTVLLSAALNAPFYVASMIAGFVVVGPLALTTALYAVGSADPTALAQKIRFTVGLAVAVGILANGALLVGGAPLLRLFGPTYAEQARWSLQLLGLGVFPLILKDHYVAVHRIHGHLARAALLVAIGSTLELTLAALGGQLGGLTGLSLGWLAGACLEASLMARGVYVAATPAETEHLPWREAEGATSRR